MRCLITNKLDRSPFKCVFFNLDWNLCIWNVYVENIPYQFLSTGFYSVIYKVVFLFFNWGQNGFWMTLQIGWGNAWILKEFTKSAVLSKWKKLLVTLQFTLKHNVTKFHICTDYLNHTNEKCSLLATKGQTLGNEHFLLSFLQRILIGNSGRKIKSIMANPSSRNKSWSSNIK